MFVKTSNSEFEAMLANPLGPQSETSYRYRIKITDCGNRQLKNHILKFQLPRCYRNFSETTETITDTAGCVRSRAEKCVFAGLLQLYIDLYTAYSLSISFMKINETIKPILCTIVQILPSFYCKWAKLCRAMFYKHSNFFRNNNMIKFKWLVSLTETLI